MPEYLELKTNPEAVSDGKENPCWKKADFEDPNEDLMEGIEKEMEGHDEEKTGFFLVWEKSRRGDGIVAEKDIEAIVSFSVSFVSV